MGCCGGGHSGHDKHSHNTSSKVSIGPWIIGLVVIVGLVIYFN